MRLSPLASLFLFVAACSSSEDPPKDTDACAQVTCGDHATCSDGVCGCDPGFVGDGTTCTVDQCIGVTCGTNAACDAGVCVCNAGYDGDGTTCVVDPCYGVTCSTNGYCLDGACFCKPTFQGDGVTCEAAAPCEGATVVENLAPKVVGCAAVVSFENRDLCGPGRHVCDNGEWRAAVDAGATPPAYHYWLDDELRYSGDGATGACAVTNDPEAGAFYYCGEGQPMRVCAAIPDDDGEEGELDPLGNECNWLNCGWQTNTPNYYFGGCEGNMTAGVLCCTNGY